MSEKPKRRFFQFHLLTTMLLMIISAVFLLLDVRWRSIEDERYPETIFVLGGDIEAPSSYSTLHWQGLGWPMIFNSQTFWPETEIVRPLSTIRTAIGRGFDPNKLEIDVLIALGLLFLTAVVSEFLIRRREARKT